MHQRKAARTLGLPVFYYKHILAMPALGAQIRVQWAIVGTARRETRTGFCSRTLVIPEGFYQ